MPTLKAGTILMNTNNKQIALVYRPKKKDYSFPKGHLEEGETLPECAVRETEEETLRANHLLSQTPIYILIYTTPQGEYCENYMYLAIDDGPTSKEIAMQDREEIQWVSIEEVEHRLSYNNLKEMWHAVKKNVVFMLKNQRGYSSK